MVLIQSSTVRLGEIANAVSGADELRLLGVKVQRSGADGDLGDGQSFPGLHSLQVHTSGDVTSLNFLKRLPNLEYLQLDLLRNLDDVSALRGCRNLIGVHIYGSPKLESIPDLSSCKSLERIELGNCKRLEPFPAVLSAPKLRELLLFQKLNVDPDRASQLLASNEGLEAFRWMTDQTPARIWEPILDAWKGKAPVEYMFEDWRQRRRHEAD